MRINHLFTNKGRENDGLIAVCFTGKLASSTKALRLAKPRGLGLVIFPFVNAQVLESGVTDREDKIGYYSGLIGMYSLACTFC